MRLTLLLALVAGFFAAFAAAGPSLAAPVLDSPEALIAYAYKPYTDEAFPEDPFELYAPSLRELVDKSIAATPEDEVGVLDFDPFIDAQDYGDVEAKVAAIKATDDHAEAQVAVSNFGATIQMTLWLVKTVKGWLIEDIARTDGEAPWRLSELLAGEPLLN